MAIIIAECCQNHKGDLKILKDMIWAAAEAGADYAKVQSILADDLTFRERFEEGVVENGVRKAIKRPYQLEYERLKPMNLDDNAFRWFIEECKKARIKPLTTVFTRSRIPFLSSLDWQEIKVASYDCASFPMIRELKEHFRHLFISTGAVFDADVRATASILNGNSFTFLHCVTIYPTPLDDLNLARIDWLRQFTPSVGFSDHTSVARDGLKASIGALYFGADLVERHFTILPTEETKDGPISINPDQLKELVEFSKIPAEEIKDYINKHVPEYDKMVGVPNRALTGVELLNRDYYRGRFASKTGDRMVYNWGEIE
ncbi:general stress protein [miscellaneous Crenarchaeota group archaeon SMTZ-80]|nr:MAG: general stress protein [miscellaneous Crenarchaeota group archaeon SMTZ-80]